MQRGLVRIAWVAVSLFPAALLFARGGWDDPPGGWDYVYEADPGQDQYVPGDDVVGLLDGSWAQSGNASRWDGSRPGEIDPDTDADGDGLLDGDAPGGVEILGLAGLGEDGGDASVLSIEDPGDPRKRDAEDRAWADPSNRKIYLYRGIEGDSDEGWTLIARFRLNPAPVDVDVSAGPNGQQMHTSGKGQVSVVDKGEGNLSLSIDDAGELEIGGRSTRLPLDDPTRFVSVWVVAQEVGAPRFAVRVYLDGAAEPALDANLDLPTASERRAPDDYIAIGLPITAEDGAIQIDYVGFKSGAYDPGNEIPGPSGMACRADLGAEPPEVNLSWTVPVPYDAIELRRDGELIATLAGDVEAYTDTPPPGQLDYELTARAGDAAWQLGPCTVVFLPDVGPWAVPPGGWDYIYDAEGHGQATPLDRYNPTPAEPGNLDGLWSRAAGSDRWDGSAPGDVDVSTDGDADGLLDGPSPGGLAIVDLAAAGPCGEPIKVLAIEDVGNPTSSTFTWQGVGRRWEDPSNRKIFLGYDTGVRDRSLLDEGVTFAVRWRLTPDPLDLAAGPDGSGFHEEMGQVGIGFRGDEAAGAGPANLSFAISTGGRLSASGGLWSLDVDPVAFTTLWATVEAGSQGGLHAVSIYVNGHTDPVFTGEVALAAGAEDTFGDDCINFLAVGSNSTSGDTAFEVDWIAYKRGIHPPAAGTCGGPGGDLFRRGDVDGDGMLVIGDAINLLNYLFAGGAVPPCLDAVDIDDDGMLVIGDAVSLLNYMFAGGRPPATPGPTTCGPDPTGDDPFGPCGHDVCR